MQILLLHRYQESHIYHIMLERSNLTFQEKTFLAESQGRSSNTLLYIKDKATASSCLA